METIPVAIGTVSTPWTTVAVAATARGIVAAELDAPPDDVLQRLVGRFARSGAAPALTTDGSPDAPRTRLDAALAAIGDWASGEPAALDPLPVDLFGLGEWDRLVLGGVRSIPWGRTAGYGEIARRIGRPGAARAVGGAVGRNPVALVIPCHRVIAGDGTIGGYGGGWWGEREDLIGLKRRLLAHEGVSVTERLAEPSRRR